MSEFEYKVVTKEDFIRYKLNNMKASMINKNTMDMLVEKWDKTRNGFNFMIAVGKEELMFYSVEYFNKHIASR